MRRRDRLLAYCRLREAGGVGSYLLAVMCLGYKRGEGPVEVAMVPKKIRSCALGSGLDSYRNLNGRSTLFTSPMNVRREQGEDMLLMTDLRG